jgi:hypothetical protein
MEYVVAIVIAAIAIGLLILFLRRPTVVRPPTTAAPAKPDAVTAAPKTDETLQNIIGELATEMPPGDGKRITILKGNKQIGWTVTRRVTQSSLSPEDLQGLMGGGSVGKLAGQLLEKLGAEALPANAPPEARLQYPGSSVVVTAAEVQQGAAAGSQELRDVHKTTFATEADGGAVLAWYQDWLVSHGWQPAEPAEGLAPSSRQYSRGSEHFRLAIGDPAAVRDLLAVPIPADAKTIYEVEYSNASTPPPA